MVKFASCEDGGYKKVSGHLWLLARDAPDAISLRWAEQDKIKMGTEDSKLTMTITTRQFTNFWQKQIIHTRLF